MSNSSQIQGNIKPLNVAIPILLPVYLDNQKQIEDLKIIIDEYKNRKEYNIAKLRKESQKWGVSKWFFGDDTNFYAGRVTSWDEEITNVEKKIEELKKVINETKNVLDAGSFLYFNGIPQNQNAQDVSREAGE